MKHLLKSFTALTASLSIAVCAMTSSLTFGADTDEKTTCIIHYDLSEDGVYIPADEDGNVPELPDSEVSVNSTYAVLSVKPEKEGYNFQGWTYDNIRGYVGTDIIRVFDEDITLHPVWTQKDDSVMHTVHYKVIINGEEYEDAKLRVPDKKMIAGRIFTVPLDVFNNPGYKQRGWTDGENDFLPETKIIMPNDDITLYPNYKKLYNLIYTVGDADRINGVTKLEYEIAEDDSTNIQSNTRFSRNGFKILRWHCETDGKDYEPDSYFVMPGNDVVMTPVWDPIRYVINFKPSSKAADNIKVAGYTDTAIIAPECEYVNPGYKFSGWQRNDLIIQPGEEYIIPGAEPGLGISFKAVWTPDNGETVTSTTTTTGTTTTTSAASTTTTTSAVTSSTTSTTTTTVTSTTSTSAASSSSTTSSSTTSSSTTTSTSVTSTVVSTNEDINYGDANCDGSVDMADVVLIMQALANPNKYDIIGSDKNHITVSGRKNADVFATGDGVTTQDALHIQKYLLGLCEITGNVEITSSPE